MLLCAHAPNGRHQKMPSRHLYEPILASKVCLAVTRDLDYNFYQSKLNMRFEVFTFSVSNLILNKKLAAVFFSRFRDQDCWKHGTKYQCTTMPVEDTTEMPYVCMTMPPCWCCMQSFATFTGTGGCRDKADHCSSTKHKITCTLTAPLA